ncbi:MAG: DUF445 family protein [Clostridiales bacterium]|nr:DUF445 family protein [Clostridiales bacterium]
MEGWANIIISPVLGAVIGYFTNWLAIKMLFRPREEKYIGRWRLPLTPGIIPKERARLTSKVAETVGGKLLTYDVLLAELTSKKTTAAVEKLLDSLIDGLRAKDLKISDIISESARDSMFSFTDEKIPDAAKIVEHILNNPELDSNLISATGRVLRENFGMASFFLNPEKIYHNIKLEFRLFIGNTNNHKLFSAKLRESAGTLWDLRVNQLLDTLSEGQTRSIKEKLMQLVAPALAQAANLIASNMDIRSMVEEKMNAFSILEAEEIILSVVKRELNVITVLGGVLGFIIGLAPVLFNMI